VSEKSPLTQFPDSANNLGWWKYNKNNYYLNIFIFKKRKRCHDLVWCTEEPNFSCSNIKLEKLIN
jgi:hypothetical protein